MLRTSGLPIEEGSALLVAPTATIDGRLWRERPIEESEARPLARHLIAACFVVIGYLSGMRSGEILSLERGCLHRDPATGLVLVRGREWKSVHDSAGEHLPQGRPRPDPWVVAEPVATAITVLEKLHREQLLFPNRLDPRPQKTSDAGHRYRDGKARTSTHINSDIAALIDWINHYCAEHGRTDAIPPDPEHPDITARRLRRTLAWFIARKPRGLVAAAIQYGHLKIQMTLGYAGTYASGFPDELAFEEWLTRLDTLADAHEHLQGGEHVSGPAAQRYRLHVQSAPRFAGQVLRTTRDARILLANPALQIYPGHAMTCVLDPRRAACRLAQDDVGDRITPDLSDCRPNCVNIARTDRDIALVRAQAARLREIVEDPLAPPVRAARQRAELHRLLRILAEHHGHTGGRDV
ncbi:hypothetical protein F3087_43935 [Nocardia colli]|uniref:Integrase n=2 Tax=Nocardia colli TaxID=2545717 RepID=A0A5N0DM33_9NOCA|nr:hypothetical protein F3087_43935 [Nocardia colli]